MLTSVDLYLRNCPFTEFKSYIIKNPNCLVQLVSDKTLQNCKSIKKTKITTYKNELSGNQIATANIFCIYITENGIKQNEKAAYLGTVLYYKMQLICNSL